MPGCSSPAPPATSWRRTSCGTRSSVTAGGSNEVTADIKVANTDLHGQYTVKGGDSLSKIARYIYGDASAFQKIFDANRDILKTPDVIHPGQILKIPRA